MRFGTATLLCVVLLGGCSYHPAELTEPETMPIPTTSTSADPAAQPLPPVPVDGELTSVDDLLRQLDDQMARADQAPADAD